MPEACGVAWAEGFDRVLTVVSSPNSQFAAGAGVTLNDVFSECGSQNACTIEPVLDANFLGEASERTGDHELTLLVQELDSHRNDGSPGLYRCMNQLTMKCS